MRCLTLISIVNNNPPYESGTSGNLNGRPEGVVNKAPEDLAGYALPHECLSNVPAVNMEAHPPM